MNPTSPSSPHAPTDPRGKHASSIEELVEELVSVLPPSPQWENGDLNIWDYSMPSMSGEQALQLLAAQPAHRATVSVAKGSTVHVSPVSASRQFGGHLLLIQSKNDTQVKLLMSVLPLVSKLLLEGMTRVREKKLKEMVDFMTGQMVVPTSVDADMAQRLAERQARVLKEFGFFTAEELAEINLSHATNQSSLANNWKKRGQVFAVHHRDRKTGRNQDVFPKFQFEDGKPLKVVQHVLEVFADRKTPWKIALWFTSNNGWLPKHSRPVDLLESDPNGVVEAARREAVGSSA